ncbi:hypothetical protein WDV76_08810 [Xenorhabdus griffiniae]|uniref:hypothetical protein n=1 Tax=Xenorhabdus griffiniae TaxID=351672 RepID=UPI0030CA712F
MLKQLTAVLLLFPCALLADSGVYIGDDGKLDIRDGNYFCDLYPTHIFNDSKNLRNFPSGYYPKVMLNVSTDGSSKSIGVDLHPSMPMDARPSGSWGYFSASLSAESYNNYEVTYKSIRDNNNFTYLIGTKNAGVIVAISSSDAFSPVNAVLGRCNQIN